MTSKKPTKPQIAVLLLVHETTGTIEHWKYHGWTNEVLPEHYKRVTRVMPPEPKYLIQISTIDVLLREGWVKVKSYGKKQLDTVYEITEAGRIIVRDSRGRLSQEEIDCLPLDGAPKLSKTEQWLANHGFPDAKFPALNDFQLQILDKIIEQTLYPK
jgi:hypothetical protein